MYKKLEGVMNFPDLSSLEKSKSRILTLKFNPYQVEYINKDFSFMELPWRGTMRVYTLKVDIPLKKAIPNFFSKVGTLGIKITVEGDTVTLSKNGLTLTL